MKLHWTYPAPRFDHIDAGIVRILPTERIKLTDADLVTLSRDELHVLENGVQLLPDVEVLTERGIDSYIELRYRAQVPCITTMGSESYQRPTNDRMQP